MLSEIIFAVIVLIVLLLVFNIQYRCWAFSLVGIVSQSCPQPVVAAAPAPASTTEHINNPKITTTNSDSVVNSTLDALGYTADAPWDQVLQATELDPSTFVNHMDFVKDVRRFSSGANFTSVTDDNTNQAFTNFVGLRRPEHVDIGPDARQQPDIDETVLQRNRGLRW